MINLGSMNENSSIKILPQELINQIAAGEVVERPASVVKELVENSLDAQAESITIEIINGGINLIKITDDGIGMSPEDARLSIAQHATSKIKQVDDLFNIESLGFRGEALASISSVSEFFLITKRIEDLSGVEIKVLNNKVENNKVGCPIGTSVEVKNLFHNVPARKKYLKTAVTEYNHIVDLFLNYVLAYRKINWKLIHNTKTIYNFSAVEDIKDRIFEVLGSEIAENLIKVNFSGLEMSITGFIGQPQIARNNRKLQFLFVNNRPVNEYIIAKQVKNAFTTLLPKDLFPVYILFLQVNPQRIDVNVHPRKTEVRFSEPQKVYQTIYRVISDTLDKSELTKQVQEFEVPANVMQDNFVAPKLETRSFKQSLDLKQKINEPSQSFSQLNNLDNLTPNSSEEKDFRILGQVQNSYILLETETSLKIIDQHAASERIQYEKLKHQWLEQKVLKQQLLIPENFNLPGLEKKILQLNLPLLAKIGFEIEEMSSSTFMINTVPQTLVKKDYKLAIKEIIGQLGKEEIGDLAKLEQGLSEPMDRILKIMACKSAIKFGDRLLLDELSALIDNLDNCDNKYTCVHGRPCVIEYKFEELEKMFKRRK